MSPAIVTPPPPSKAPVLPITPGTTCGGQLPSLLSVKCLLSLFLPMVKYSSGDRGNENFLHFDVIPLYSFEIPGFLLFLLFAKILCKGLQMFQDSDCPRGGFGIDDISRVWFFHPDKSLALFHLRFLLAYIHICSHTHFFCRLVFRRKCQSHGHVLLFMNSCFPIPQKFTPLVEYLCSCKKDA